MITGQVSENREAIVPVTVFGFGGKSVTVNAVIDTGFDDFLSLPLELVATLALVARESVSVMLADGSVVESMYFEAEALWHGKRRPITVQVSPGMPLIGMTLLEDSRLIIEAEPGGKVFIQRRRR